MGKRLQALAHMDDLYKNILDSISDGVYFVDKERRIIFWNHGAELITGYSASEVIGTHCSDNILVHVDDCGRKLCIDNCPLLDTLNNGNQRSAQLFLHHKNGHRLLVSITINPIYDEAGNIVGAVELFRKQNGEPIDQELVEELKKAALFDPLTGIPNRRLLDMKINSSLYDTERYDVPFGVIMADIDHFKDINDTWGHTLGDEVLKMIASTLSQNIRPSDTIGRWGGEEFLGVINHVNVENLKIVSEKLRILVENSFIQHNKQVLHTTITIGCSIVQPVDTMETIMERADTQLYNGKRSGRNCVICS